MLENSLFEKEARNGIGTSPFDIYVCVFVSKIF
jgi:hypothetical protein